MSPENPEGIAARLNRGMRSASAKVTFVSRVRFGERLELSRYRLGNGLGILLLPDRSATHGSTSARGTIGPARPAWRISSST
jgi:hypothetical protein